MSGDIDPLLWPEPSELPQANLGEFFNSCTPEASSDFSALINPTSGTPSCATHPWEPELMSLQAQNDELIRRLGDVPRLLGCLDQQRAELVALRRRLVNVEVERHALQKKVRRLERVSKRPRVDSLCAACGGKRDRCDAVEEWLQRFALDEQVDPKAGTGSFLAVLKQASETESLLNVASTVCAVLLDADYRGVDKTMRLFAAAIGQSSEYLRDVVYHILDIVEERLQQRNGAPASSGDMVRVVLQGTAVGVWKKRATAEVFANFVASHRGAGDLLRFVFSPNKVLAKKLFIDETDGRDLNVLWGPSFQSVLTYYTRNPAIPDSEAYLSFRKESLLARWNNVRTTVEDLQGHASLHDAETAIVLESAMMPVHVCFHLVVKKGLCEYLPSLATETEKVDKMLSLISSVLSVFDKDQSAEVQENVRVVPVWLIALSCVDGLEAKLSVRAINMAAALLSSRAIPETERNAVKEGLTHWSRTVAGTRTEEHVKKLSDAARELLRSGMMITAATS